MNKKKSARPRRYVAACWDARPAIRAAEVALRYAPLALLVVCAVASLDMQTAHAGVLDSTHVQPIPRNHEIDRILRDRAYHDRLMRQDQAWWMDRGAPHLLWRALQLGDLRGSIARMFLWGPWSGRP